jgi:hypothetical protein
VWRGDIGERGAAAGEAGTADLPERAAYRRLIVVLVAAAVLRAVPAAGMDVKLWPLFRYARDDKNGLVRWSAFGPLIDYSMTEETRDLRIRPLIWIHQRRGVERDDHTDILYPIISSRWRDDYQSFRFLFFTYRTAPVVGAPRPEGRPPPIETWASRLTLLPFVFYRHSPEGTHLSVFPLWLDLDDFFGWSHVRAVLFPAYLRLDEPGVTRRFMPFPFFSTVGGELGSGVRFWPVYGDTEIAGKEHTHYAPWPFAVRSERLVPGYGWERRRLYFPAYAKIEGAGRETRGYGMVYLHTTDTRHGVESTGNPWPFSVRERALGETEFRTWRVFPFFGRTDNRGISSRFYAWPAYRTKSQDADGFHYRRRDVGLVLWRRQIVDSERSGHEEELTTLFPVLRDARDDDRRYGQSPALLDSLLPKNRGILELWAPLYGVYRWDTRPDGARDWNAGWGLVAREDGRLRGPWYLERDGG